MKTGVCTRRQGHYPTKESRSDIVLKRMAAQREIQRLRQSIQFLSQSFNNGAPLKEAKLGSTFLIWELVIFELYLTQVKVPPPKWWCVLLKKKLSQIWKLVIFELSLTLSGGISPRQQRRQNYHHDITLHRLFLYLRRKMCNIDD